MTSIPHQDRQQSMSSAQADVDYLLQTSNALLSLTPSHLFRTYNDLSAYLKVASTQRNFSLRAVFEQPEFGRSDIRFRCQAFTTVGLPGTSDGACLSFWSVEQVGGYWRIAKAQINHNHILQEIISPNTSINSNNSSSSTATPLHSKQIHSDANGGMMSSQRGSNIASCSHHGSNNRGEGSKLTFQTSSVFAPIPQQERGSMNGSAPVAQNGYSFNSNINQPQPPAGPLPAEAHLVFQPNLLAAQAIADLRQTGYLAFPTFTNQLSFPTHDSFRVYACAAALEQGFGLSLRNFGPQASLGRFTLQCISDMSRIQHLTPTPCPFEMTVVMLSRNGVVSWSIGRENQHSDACLKTRVVQQLNRPTGAIGQAIPPAPKLIPRPVGTYPVIPLVIRSAPPIPLVLPTPRPAPTSRKIPVIREDSASSSSEEKPLVPLKRLHRGKPKASLNSRSSSRYNSVASAAAAATTTVSGRKRVNYAEADESDFSLSPSRSLSPETLYLQKNLPTRRFSPVKLSPIPILGSSSSSRLNTRYSPYNKPSSPVRTTFPTPSTSQDEFSPFTPIPTSSTPSSPKFTVKDLKHFLHSLSPLLTQFAPLLFNHGLTSIKAIDNLISLDKESLELMIDGLAKGEAENGMKGLHRVILRSKILDIQDRFNGVAIEGEDEIHDF